MVLFRLPPQDVVAKMRVNLLAALLQANSGQFAKRREGSRTHSCRSVPCSRVSGARSPECGMCSSGGRDPPMPSGSASFPISPRLEGSCGFPGAVRPTETVVSGPFLAASPFRGTRPSVRSTRPPIRRTSEHHAPIGLGRNRPEQALPASHDRISAERRGSRDAWSPMKATRRRTESNDRTSSPPPFDSDADPANRMDRSGSAPSRARHEKVEVRRPAPSGRRRPWKSRRFVPVFSDSKNGATVALSADGDRRPRGRFNVHASSMDRILATNSPAGNGRYQHQDGITLPRVDGDSV